MIAAEDEARARAPEDRLHAAPVGFDACGARIVKTAAVNRAPEVCIEFEVGAAPTFAHGAKDQRKVLLRFGVRAVEHVPRAASPAAERDAIRAERFAFFVTHKPIRVLLEDVRLLFRDERRDPDGRLEAARANLFKYALHVAAESRARLQPIAHRRLIAVIYLNVLETRNVFGDEVQIVEHLLSRDARPEAVPRAPARRRRLRAQGRMVLAQTRGQLREQLFARCARSESELFQLPRLTWLQFQAFSVNDDLQR